MLQLTGIILTKILAKWFDLNWPFEPPINIVYNEL